MLDLWCVGTDSPKSGQNRNLDIGRKPKTAGDANREEVSKPNQTGAEFALLPKTHGHDEQAEFK